MDDSLEGITPGLRAFRRYVTDYVNRHDFSAIHEFMTDNYSLESSGVSVAGRDGAYRAAVARQLDQFPGLVFTPHELFVCGDRIAVRFTEHGAARRDGKRAAWTSIAIYRSDRDRLASCRIEQDYAARSRQLRDGRPDPVDTPAIAPWDTPESSRDPGAEAVVLRWLQEFAYLDDPLIRMDDERVTRHRERLVDPGDLSVLELVSGTGKVAFHAVQRGPIAADAADHAAMSGTDAHIHLSGIVDVVGNEVSGGHVMRDRFGLRRRMAASRPPAPT